MTDDELLAAARQALPGYHLELRREEDVATLYAVFTVGTDSSTTELGMRPRAAAYLDAELGDEIYISIWSSHGLDDRVLVALDLAALPRIVRRALVDGRLRTPDEDDRLLWAKRELIQHVIGAETSLVRLGERLAMHRDTPGAVRELGQELMRLLAEQATAEATWPAGTVSDRLDAAFVELDATGILALHHATETQSGGWTAAIERTSLRGGTWRGAVFYHGQDLDSTIAGAGLCLAFGSLEDAPTDDAVLAIGAEVVATLRRHGLEPAWSGDGDSRITLPPFPWRRRRRPDRTSSLELGEWQRLPAELVTSSLPELRELKVDLGVYDVDALASTSVQRLQLCFVERAAAIAALTSGLPEVRSRFPALEELIVADAGGRTVTLGLCATCGPGVPLVDGTCHNCGGIGA